MDLERWAKLNKVQSNLTAIHCRKKKKEIKKEKKTEKKNSGMIAILCCTPGCGRMD